MDNTLVFGMQRNAFHCTTENDISTFYIIVYAEIPGHLKSNHMSKWCCGHHQRVECGGHRMSAHGKLSHTRRQAVNANNGHLVMVKHSNAISIAIRVIVIVFRWRCTLYIDHTSPVTWCAVFSQALTPLHDRPIHACVNRTQEHLLGHCFPDDWARHHRAYRNHWDAFGAHAFYFPFGRFDNHKFVSSFCWWKKETTSNYRWMTIGCDAQSNAHFMHWANTRRRVL